MFTLTNHFRYTKDDRDLITKTDMLLRESWFLIINWLTASFLIIFSKIYSSLLVCRGIGITNLLNESTLSWKLIRRQSCIDARKSSYNPPGNSCSVPPCLSFGKSRSLKAPMAMMHYVQETKMQENKRKVVTNKVWKYQNMQCS